MMQKHTSTLITLGFRTNSDFLHFIHNLYQEREDKMRSKKRGEEKEDDDVISYSWSLMNQ